MPNSENKLSSPVLRSAKPKSKKYRLHDGGKLYCEVLTTGRMVWRYAYRFGEPKPNKAGKLIRPEKTYTIGKYPDISIKEARKSAILHAIRSQQVLIHPMNIGQFEKGVSLSSRGRRYEQEIVILHPA